ncbi:centrosomal protein of 89 kDa isoform X2 [Protopterus annectens]|uniref:centrosomal protein of 89 kDa isoform X2 n=1 Tax=Protopterus annectens TaxID=7888 RepID=UPI001CF94172|nr:centrosomal protein of 89 kDa isoform X2 [Protopterus annectens]
MSFRFRRKEKMNFKHIAHGLVPAATIAPRCAVPRTPPPRSPNPSPERPRSALAAAILVSSLTGRVVAIPQPRPRSYSEGDSISLDQDSIVEPYATADGLGLSVLGRPRMPSPAVSDDDLDDDYMEEEEMAVTEKEPFYHILEKEKDIHRYESDDYAIPQKEKTEESQVIMSGELTDGSENLKSQTEREKSPVPDSEIEEQGAELQPQRESLSHLPSQDLTDNMNAEELSSLSTRNQSSSKKKKQAEQEKSDSTDYMNVVISTLSTRNQSSAKKKNQAEQEKSGKSYHEVTDIRKEMMQNLKITNRNLVAEKQVLIQQLQEHVAQLQKMQQKQKKLENENKRIKEAVQNLTSQDNSGELQSLRQQAQELVDENDSLKMTVHRLNVELSRYQTKYRPLSKEESSQIAGLPSSGPPPPWLLDMKYLSPLLLSYEDRMREKDITLATYEEEMKNFSLRVEEVLKENEQLHQQLEKSGPITNKAWRQLQDQAKLVLEENQVLMEQIEVQQAKAKDSHNHHVQEVSKLAKQLMILEEEKTNLKNISSEQEKEIEALHCKYEQLRADQDKQMPVAEHTRIMEEMKRLLQQEQDNHQAEVEELLRKIASLQAEKKSLLLEKTNLAADNKSLETELEMERKISRKSQKKIGILKQQVEDAMDKEIAAHQYLANMISLAEKTVQERDQLIHMAKSLECEKQGVFTKAIEGNVRLGQLMEKVKLYKKQASVKLGDLSFKMKEQEEDFAGKIAQHHREIRHLQRLLQDKQETLDEALQQKRQVEGELNILCESASRETKRIKEFLYESLQSKDSWNHLDYGISAEDIPRRDTSLKSELKYSDLIYLSPQRGKHCKKTPPAAAHSKDVVDNKSKNAIKNVIQQKKYKEGILKSPMFEYDSDQQQNTSSDESEKNVNGLDFYS